MKLYQFTEKNDLIKRWNAKIEWETMFKAFTKFAASLGAPAIYVNQQDAPETVPLSFLKERLLWIKHPDV